MAWPSPLEELLREALPKRFARKPGRLGVHRSRFHSEPAPSLQADGPSSTDVVR